MKWHNWILFILLIVASSCKDEQSEPGNVDEVDDVFIGNMCNLFFTEGLELREKSNTTASRERRS